MKNYWESMEKQLNSSGISSLFRRSRLICENGISIEPEKTQTGSSSCQCSTISTGQEKENKEFVFRIQKKSRKTRKDFRRDTGCFSVLETKRSCMQLFFAHLKENGTLQPLEWKDSKILVIQYSRV